MDSHIAETQYPLTFREETAKSLGENLQQQKSVELVGMKRVGINNFLRFFLFHEDIKKYYLPKDGKHFFILIDLNDLIERELFPFWRLTFKRIVDAVEKSSFKETIKKKISSLFLASIQSGDLFLTYDGVREALSLLAGESIYPTLFLTRFDRLNQAATPDFFNNLQSLKDATGNKLCYVFTSFRELDVLMPNAFNRKDLSVFSQVLYIKPTAGKDSDTILKTMQKYYKLSLDESISNEIIKLAGGHTQYIHLSLLVLSEQKKQLTPIQLKEVLLADERINLQSEELWESLNEEEKNILLKIINDENLDEISREKGKYLWNVGFVNEDGGNLSIFSKLLEEYLKKQKKKEKEPNGIEFSKKENKLFKYLEMFPNEICERENIVDNVWPEYKEYGVSDWSVDRLVARVRGKLKKQNSPYEVITVRTRGYKLVTK